MPRYELVAGLDIGTAKVSLAVARREFNSKDPDFLGCFSLPCEGMKSGAVVDLAKVADSVGAVLDEAQAATKQKINTAFVNLSGTHIIGENSRGKVNTLNKEIEISKKDLDAACNNAKVSIVTYDRQPILVVPQAYMVDGQGIIKNPLGLFGSRLSVDYLFVTGLTPSIANLRKAVNMGGLEIEELVLSNLASSFSVLSSLDKEIGVILVDIGSDVTEVTVFSEGIVRFEKMLPCGSENLSNAIAVDLKVRTDIANKIVTDYCRVYSSVGAGHSEEKILIKEVTPPKTITEGYLQNITEAKIKEILNIIKDAMQSSNYSSGASSGVVLIGSISAMDGLAEMAEAIFNMPVKLGLPKDAVGTNMNNANPACATAMGLVRYGCQALTARPFARQLSDNMIKRAFQAARDFIYDYF